MSFKTYVKYSILKTLGGILFYLGFAVLGVGVFLVILGQLSRLIAPILPFAITFFVIGIVLFISGYMINSYGKFGKNAEQIAKGVSKGIKNTAIPSHSIPPPPSNICPACRRALTFIEQYNAWYCFNCKEYR